MGSMGSMMNFKYTILEMLTMKPSLDDKIVDCTQDHVGADVELSVDDHEVATDKGYFIKECPPCYDHFPKRSRTRRFFVGNLRYNPEDGVEYLDTQIIVDKKNSSIEGVDQLCSSAEMIVDEKNSRKRKSRKGFGEDYIVCDDDYGEEEGSKRKVVKKTAGPRKAVQVYDLPTELPQNLQEYISELNLEVPPKFVAQKLLFVSDISSNLGRLLLPKSLVSAEFLDNFLTKVERRMLEKEVLEVNLVDDKLREFSDLCMTSWNMNSSSPYALRTAWNTVVLENNFKTIKMSKDSKKTIVAMKDDDDLWKTDVVAQVWCFRRDSKIWLALHTQAMVELDTLGVEKDENGDLQFE